MAMKKLLRPLISDSLREWAYARSGFNQFGLRRDDMIYPTPDVEEAVRRMPHHLQDERNFRIVRALYLDTQKSILPKEQWTKLKDDVRYMQPYLDEVIQEREEKEKWDASF